MEEAKVVEVPAHKLQALIDQQMEQTSELGETPEFEAEQLDQLLFSTSIGVERLNLDSESGTDELYSFQMEVEVLGSLLNGESERVRFSYEEQVTREQLIEELGRQQARETTELGHAQIEIAFGMKRWQPGDPRIRPEDPNSFYRSLELD